MLCFFIKPAKLAPIICSMILFTASALVHAETMLSFTGNDSYVNIGTPAALQIPSNNPFTIEGWMLFNALSSRDMLYCKNNARSGSPYTFLLGFADHKLAAYNSAWRGSFAVSRELDRWYHVAFSFDGTDMSFYLDGALLGATAFSFINTEAHTVKIGGYIASADINGMMSDVRVWDHARNEAEIFTDMTCRMIGNEPGLIAYWPLDEGVGGTACDGTANNSDGTIVNASWDSADNLEFAPAGSDFRIASFLQVADKQTGNTEFTNSNQVDVVEFPVPNGHDLYQLTEGDDIASIDQNGWLAVDSLPSELSFAQPGADEDIIRYAWFTNTTESVLLRRARAEIRYTKTCPTPVTAGYYLCEMDETGEEALLYPADFDWGSTGGITGDKTIPLHAISLNLLSGPDTNSTPDADWITVRETGEYQLELVAMNAAGNQAASEVFTVAVVSWAGPKTEGDVIWSGGAGVGNPYWNVSENWAGGEAPANPTPGTVFFQTGGQDIASVLTSDRQLYRIEVGLAGNTTAHIINLANNTLQIKNSLFIAANATTHLTFENGTVKFGADTAMDLTIRGKGTLAFGPGMMLSGANINEVFLSGQGWGSTPIIDLRGAKVVGGALTMRKLLMPATSWYGSRIYIDATTDLDAIVIKDAFELGCGSINDSFVQYIGDPSDTFTMDGKTFGKLPPDTSLRFGVDADHRCSVIISDSTSSSKVRSAIRASSGGECHAFLSELKIATRTGDTQRAPVGMLHLAEMDSCMLDVHDLFIAPGRENAEATDDERGELHLPPGTVTVGNAIIGADGGIGFGMLVLNQTVFTVVNNLLLNKTADVTIKVGATPTGFDVTGAFNDAEGIIHVDFLTQPLVETNWAIRAAGDISGTLKSMIGSGRLTWALDPAIIGKKAGVVTDAGHTYFGLVPDTLPLDPFAAARDTTFEIGPDNVVLVHPAEVDNGSFDPEHPETPVQLRLVYNGGPQSENLEFNVMGDYPVTLVANVISGGEIVASASATATVHVVALSAGTQDDVEWCGDAGTVLMPDRREWFWSGNWTSGMPPTNPYTGTIIYRTLGQQVHGRLANDRWIAGINAGENSQTIAHTIDLGTKTLTIGNQLFLLNQSTTHMIFTNGTVRLGAETEANLTIRGKGTVTFSPGSKLICSNINEVFLSGQEWASTPIIDLRGAEVVGGALTMRKLLMPATSWYGSRIYIDATTDLDAIVIKDAFELGCGSINDSFVQYIGDPSDTFTMDGKTFGKLPPDTSLRFGVDADHRCSVIISDSTSSSKVRSAIRASSGGECHAFLSELKIATRTGDTQRAPVGMLHLAEMDSCMLDVHDLFIAPGRENAEATDDERGELHLPPGTATVGNAVIGAVDGVGIALLSTSNTTFIVTSSIAFNKTAQAEFTVTGTSSGLDIRNPEPNALTVADGAALTITFAEPETDRPFYGLRWTGSHVDDIQAMIDDGRLVVDNSGLGREISIFTTSGATWLGLPPYDGTAIMFH